MSVPVLYESHCHTPLCKHAIGDPTEYAAVAEARGLKGIIFTCHSPLPGGHSARVRMSPGIFERIEPFLKKSLDRIAATGVAMELNTSGLNKALPEMNPGLKQLALMRERGIPVVIGADAHRPERVGDNFDLAIGMLREVGYK